MSHIAERVGPLFSTDGMLLARAETRKAISLIAQHIRPGMLEEDAVEMAKEIIRAQGHASSWHPTRVRFGSNTMKAMKQPSAHGVVLRENDIFFIDIAPRVKDWEGDGGASFVIGQAHEYARCVADAESLFHEVREVWRDRQWTGQQLYDFAKRRADEMGWKLNMDLPGHRVSDFPHSALYTGALADFDQCPSVMRWILEIHLTDPNGNFGAFFEDMLLEDFYYSNKF